MVDCMHWPDRHHLRLVELRLLRRTSQCSQSCQKGPLANRLLGGEAYECRRVSVGHGLKGDIGIATP